MSKPEVVGFRTFVSGTRVMFVQFSPNAACECGLTVSHGSSVAQFVFCEEASAVNRVGGDSWRVFCAAA